MKYVFPLLALIFTFGCVSIFPQAEVIGGGLVVTLQPDPSAVFSSGRMRLNVDLDNENTRRIYGVNFDVFDPGLFSISSSQPFFSAGSCTSEVGTLLPDEFKTFACVLDAPPAAQLLSGRTTTTISAKVSYTTDLPTVQLVEMMTESEYLRRLESGQLVRKPKSYSYRDKNVQLVVEFNDELPVAVRTDPGKEYFVSFTIRNIGNGFISRLNYGDFTVSPSTPQSPQIADCENSGILSPGWSLEPVGDEFPKITCRLFMPEGVRVVENYGLLVNLVYDYEVREQADVEIIR